ncbi:MAG: PAS domain-containing protein [Anaerolineae bacterium]
MEKLNILSVWTRLTEPHSSITDIGEQRQARLLAGLMLVFAPLATFIIVLFPLFDPTTTLTFSSLVSAAALFGLYGLSRTRHVQATALLLVVVTTIAIIYPSLSSSTAQNANSLYYLVIPLVLASILLPLRGLLTAIVVLGISIVAVPLFNILPTNIAGPMTIFGISSVLLVIFVVHRDGLQQDRQGEIGNALAQAEAANAALAESQRMLKLVMDSIPQNICWKDRNSVYMGSNRNFAKLLGFNSPEELIGKSDFDVPGSAEKAADFQRDDRRVMEADKAELNFEEELPRADGSISWLSTTKIPLHDAKNNVNGVLVMLEDITARKQQELEVLESRNFLQLVLDTIPVGVFWKDRDSFVVGCNKLFAQDAGFDDVAALLGHEGKKRVAPKEESKFRADELEIMETGIPRLGYEEILTLPNRDSLIIQTNKLPLRNTSGEIIGTLGTYTDITRRKQQEQEVRESRNLLQLVLDTIPVRVFWKDSNLTYLGCNQLFANDANLQSPADIIGRTDYELFPGDADMYRADDQRVIDTGDVKLNFEEPQTLGDGSQIWLRTSKIPLRNIAGDIVGVMGTYDDITEQRRQEDVRNELIQELQTANILAEESVRLKSEFMSTMSHELRTPLNAIRGFTGIMLEGMGGDIDDEARHMLGRIDSNSARLLGLINDLLDIAKIEAGRMELVNEPLSPHALAERWEALNGVLAEQKGLKLNVTVDPELPQTVVGDSERLTQVVTNLISNAIKFTHVGGVTLNLKRQNEQWIIQVSDTGIGIPPHALNYIFDEFRQVDGSTKRAYGGSGLGLAIVRNLCRMMGGNIKVTSELGKGSVFTVNLPLVFNKQNETSLLETA